MPDDLTKQCCDNPDIRTLESNGRQFCASCRRYLTPAPVKRPITTGRSPRDGDEDGRDEVRIKPL